MCSAVYHCSRNTSEAEKGSTTSCNNTLGIVIVSWDSVFHSSRMKPHQDLRLDAATRVLALLFLDLEKTCSSLQINPELIRIMGMYYMNSILRWIFPASPLLETCLSSICSLGIHVKLWLQPTQTSFPCRRVQRAAVFFPPTLFISSSHGPLVYWKTVVLCCSISG